MAAVSGITPAFRKLPITLGFAVSIQDKILTVVAPKEIAGFYARQAFVAHHFATGKIAKPFG